MRPSERVWQFGFALLVPALFAAPAVQAWEVRINGTAHYLDAASDVVIDLNGDVIAVGSLANGPLYDGFDDADNDFFVVKLANPTGAELWRRGIDGGDFDSAKAVAVDAVGDVVVGGEIDGSGRGSIVKLSGVTGEELWRHAEPTVSFGARSIVVDSAGDVLVAGSTPGDPGVCSCLEFAVVKLDGLTGVERWHYGLNTTPGYAYALAADGAGNVVAVGLAGSHGSLANDTVVKLAGLTGTEAWRARLASPGAPYENLTQVVFDSASDVIVGGSIQNPTTSGDLLVAKLAGASGDEQWRHTIDGAAHGAEDIAFAVAVDGSGDVVASGTLENEPHYGTFVVTKLAAATGMERWRFERLGTNGASFDVAVHGNGDVVAAGVSGPAPLHTFFTTTRLDGASGTPRWFSVFEEHDGEADAVAIDGSGDVISVGSINYPDELSEFGPTGDFVVRKVRGTDGRLPVGPACGDGTTDAGEECDDGNLVDGDGCDSNCTRTGCGNLVVTAGESCDDGNTQDGDGCESTCMLTVAGSCANAVDCVRALSSVLPRPEAAPTRAARKAARTLVALEAKIENLLGKAERVSTEGKRRRSYRKARKTTMKLLVRARAFDGHGPLGVPLAPIEAAVRTLLAYIPDQSSAPARSSRRSRSGPYEITGSPWELRKAAPEVIRGVCLGRGGGLEPTSTHEGGWSFIRPHPPRAARHRKRDERAAAGDRESTAPATVEAVSRDRALGERLRARACRGAHVGRPCIGAEVAGPIAGPAHSAITWTLSSPQPSSPTPWSPLPEKSSTTALAAWENVKERRYTESAGPR